MTDITFSLSIPHTPWVEERCKTVARLLESITPIRGIDVGHKVLRVFTDRSANHVWSQEMWNWGAAQDTTHFLQLQDDCMISPFFWRDLRAMVRALPNEVIGLESAHPAAKILSLENGNNWFTTSDGLIGVGYCLPTALLKEFLEWRELALLPGAVEAISEDSLIGLWCMVTRRHVYHPIPTIIDHDVSVPSTYGNEHHSNRRPHVLWNDFEMVSYARGPNIRHVGRMYEASPRLAKQWVRGVTEKDYNRFLNDNAEQEHSRLRHLAKSRDMSPRASLLICTPTRGGVHPQYAASVWGLLRSEAFDLSLGYEVFDAQLWSEDVVRVRSRFVQHFLTKTECTHLLFIDSDIKFTPRTIINMLAADKDFIGAPYARRDGIDFERCRKVPGDMPAEVGAYRYSLRTLPEGLKLDERGCAEVGGLGFGCVLIKREMLQTMWDDYPQDKFIDTLPSGAKSESVALFDLVRDEDNTLLSEDYSFCQRALRAGFKLHMYLGLDSPVDHYGEHGYKGSVEAFGFKRMHTT